jgi:hypothetical protein
VSGRIANMPNMLPFHKPVEFYKLLTFANPKGCFRAAASHPQNKPRGFTSKPLACNLRWVSGLPTVHSENSEIAPVSEFSELSFVECIPEVLEVIRTNLNWLLF